MSAYLACRKPCVQPNPLEWNTPVILALRRWRPENRKLKVILKINLSYRS